MPLVEAATSGFTNLRKSKSSKTFARVEWGDFERTFPCEVEATNSRTHFKEYS